MAVTPFKFLQFYVSLQKKKKKTLVAPPLLLLLLLQIFLCSTLIATSEKASNGSSSTRIVRVDQSGHGDHKKIQDAIDAVPSNNDQHVLILVKPGTYREKIVVPKNKPFVTLSGTDASNTIITLGDGGGILKSATFSVSAPDFVARHLTIQNTFGKSGVGVALCVSGDRAAFYNCRIISYQDTLLDDRGRHYYKDCYIEGATDFICGNAASLFERCHIHSVSRNYGAITAHHRNSESENTGYIFSGCKLTGDGKMILGRPWGTAARVVFAETYMSSAVSPEGWHDWGDPTRQRTVFYGEYKCTGPGANRTKRVGWSRSLSSDEAAPFLSKSMIGGQSWLRPTPTKTDKPSHGTAPKGKERKHAPPTGKDDKKKHTKGDKKKHSPRTPAKGNMKKKNSFNTTEKGYKRKKHSTYTTAESKKWK